MFRPRLLARCLTPYLPCFVASISVGLVVSTAACRPEIDPIEPVVVGVLNPLTGSLGSLGAGWENAARLAGEQVNASGGLFDGRPLELRFYDTQTTPNVAADKAREALQDQAVAIIGPGSSGESLTTLDIIASAEKPQISCCATSPELTVDRPAADRWFFRTTPNDLLQGQAVAFLAKEGFTGDVETFAACPEAILVHRDDSYGQNLSGVFTSNYQDKNIDGSATTKGKILADIPYNSAATGAALDTEAARVGTLIADTLRTKHAFAQNPHICVLLVSFASDGSKVINALDEAIFTVQEERRNAGNPDDANFTFNYDYLGTDGIFDAAFARDAGGAGAKMLGVAPTHARNDAYDQFDKAYRVRFGESPVTFTSNMYDAVMLMSLAITTTRSTEGADIREALFSVSAGGLRMEGRFYGEVAEQLLQNNDVDYVGPAGELDFDEFGDVVGDFVLWRPGRNGAGQAIVKEQDFLGAKDFAQ